jgi:poly(A) polymerase
MKYLPKRFDLPLPQGVSLEVHPNTVFIVGGSIRDILMGRMPIDYDLAVAIDPEKFAQRLATITGGQLVALGKPGLRLYRVATSSHVFDVSKLAGSTIEEDLLNRDFTINAMAADLANGNIIDIANGRDDLTSNRIHMVSDTVFAKDPIRLVRAFRMAASFNFRISRPTADVIQRQALLIAETAGERIWSELTKILQTSQSVRFVGQMADCGLLQIILPEIATGPHATPSVDTTDTTGFNHILAAYSELENRLLDPSEILGAHKILSKQSPITIPSGLLKFAILLKDLAEPPLSKLGKQHYLTNRPLEPIRRRLRMSNRETDYIESIILNHQKMLPLFTSFMKQRLSDTAVTQLFMSCEDILPDLILYVQSIVVSDTNWSTIEKKNFSIFAQELQNRYYSVYFPLSKEPPILTGKDLISHFNISPSPIFRFLLNAVETDRLAEQIYTKKEALKLVGQLLQEKQKDI